MSKDSSTGRNNEGAKLEKVMEFLEKRVPPKRRTTTYHQIVRRIQVDPAYLEDVERNMKDVASRLREMGHEEKSFRSSVYRTGDRIRASPIL